MTKLTLDIHQDTDAESPREWDNLGTMACQHSRYVLGNKDGKALLLEAVEANQHYCEAWSNPNSKHYKDLDNLYSAYYIAKSLGFVVLPLYLYDHSGITISTSPFSCQWDSGQVGFIFVSPDKMRAEFGVKRITSKLRRKVEAHLRREVETYDHYLTGNVWGFTLENGEGEIVSSCYGFYGEHETSGLNETVAYSISDCEVVK